MVIIAKGETSKKILEKAADLRDTGKYIEAINILTQGISQFPTDPNLRAGLSHCYILNNNIKEAYRHLNEAKEIDPTIAQVGWNEARLLLKDKKPHEALTIGKKTNKAFPDDIEGMTVLASCLMTCGDNNESLKFLNAALKLKPDYAEALINRGLINLEQKDIASGLIDLEKAFLLKPHIKGIWDLLIGLNIKTENYSTAMHLITKMIEIDPDSQKIWSVYQVCSRKIDDLSLAINSFEKVLEIKPDDAFTHFSLGATLHKQGQSKKATKHFRKVTLLEPNNAKAYFNIGITLQDQGDYENALIAYRNAIKIKSDYAEAYFNIGITLQDQGDHENALIAYRNAIKIKSDYAEAYNNLGTALHIYDKLQEAIEAYKNAIELNPHYAEAYNNLGNSLKDQDNIEEAVEAYKKALTIKPDYAEAYNNIGNALTGITIMKPDMVLQSIICSLLDKKSYVRPSDIAVAAITLLKLEPKFQRHLRFNDSDELRYDPMDIVSDLGEFPLLMKLMSVCPIPDLALENLLKELRESILTKLLSLDASSPHLLRFQSALALQCFTNEYIYSHTENERKILKSLDANIKKALKNKEQPDPQVILALASYKSLNEYDWYNLLVVTDHIKEVFTRQVEEPNHEEELKKQLPILEEITNSISLKVRGQYEENPYPRWVNLGLPLNPFSILEVVDQIKLKLYDNKITGVRKPEILVAGCGTGQHSIGTAARFKSSKVLAIDLSLSSLSYAKLKTEYLGIENISYMQADIFDLEKLNKQFDIVESAGVLHHMDDPMAGWKVLTNCLKPGGLMKIGLYSELARRHIVEMRQEISNAGIGSSRAEIKAFREMVMTSDQKNHKKILGSNDFYSMSTIKDLLFHVQEHRFTIPQIEDCLNQLGLKFCGFQDPRIVSHFIETNKAKDDLYDLQKWQEYEKATPGSFGGMYQFWCQKVD